MDYNILKKLRDLANDLDASGFSKEADFFDNMLLKFSQVDDPSIKIDPLYKKEFEEDFFKDKGLIAFKDFENIDDYLEVDDDYTFKYTIPYGAKPNISQELKYVIAEAVSTLLNDFRDYGIIAGLKFEDYSIIISGLFEKNKLNENIVWHFMNRLKVIRNMLWSSLEKDIMKKK
jgi:hypothetical protein